VTHARLRAAQGDLGGARRILGAILEREPGHAAALELLARLAGVDRPPAAEPEEPAAAPPAPGDAAALAERFRHRLGLGPAPRNPRAARLEQWLRRVTTREP
jgi:hypothetical protein